jgi:tRNA (guanine26-N2/guanine27-N2)-dimethyltransferase
LLPIPNRFMHSEHPPDPPHQEGKASFHLGNAFYRPSSQLSRDLGVLAASLEKADRPSLRVLDVMTGCGIRALRYALEADADFVWANDGNPEVGPVLAANLAVLPAEHYRITQDNASRVFYQCALNQDYYDLIDIDAFGSPAAHLGACLQASAFGGLIYLTSTDGRSVSGHFPEQSLQQFGGYARAHPGVYEQSLRLLLGSIHQQAGLQGWSIAPMFSLYHGHVARVMVRLTKRHRNPELDSGFVGYCHSCGHYETLGWRQLARALCPVDQRPLTITGPLWIGPLHDGNYLSRMARLALDWGWTAQAALLDVMQAETNLPPYFYLLGEIGRRGQLDIPKRERLLAALRERGYRAAPTHIHREGLKTDAPFAVCVALAQALDPKTVRPPNFATIEDQNL